MSIHRKRARTPLTALLPCLLVLLPLLLPQSSLADTITFYDLSDTITVSVTDPSRETVSVNPSDLPYEFADVTIGPPVPGARIRFIG